MIADNPKSFRAAMRVHCSLKVILMVMPFIMVSQVFALDPAKSVYQFNCRNWTHQNGLLPDKINSIVQSKDGYIWLGTLNGLVRFDGLDFKIVPINLQQAHGQEVRRLICSREGELLFGIQNGGFGGYNGKRFFPVGDGRWAQPGMNATARRPRTAGSWLTTSATAWISLITSLAIA